MRSASFAAAFIAAVCASGPGQAQTKRFDGRWSVEAITERGDCGRAFRWPVIVENGRARYGGSEPFNVSGRISGNGSITGTISYAGYMATVRGRLSRGWGAGSWSANTPSRNCSGRWNAERRE
jgi:hypothetical protein